MKKLDFLQMYTHWAFNESFILYRWHFSPFRSRQSGVFIIQWINTHCRLPKHYGPYFSQNAHRTDVVILDTMELMLTLSAWVKFRVNTFPCSTDLRLCIDFKRLRLNCKLGPLSARVTRHIFIFHESSCELYCLKRYSRKNTLNRTLWYGTVRDDAVRYGRDKVIPLEYH